MKLVAIAVFIAVFSFSSRANAGFFSFFEGLFGSKSFNEETLKTNSQTVALLESALNPNTENGRGGIDITIVNQNALLPDSGPLGTIADIEEEKPISDQISVYIVREGDNLSQIAKMFGVSVNTIIWANDINRGDLIKTGQELVILPITGIRYTVKKGDTLKSIAGKLRGNADEIAEFNNLDPSKTLAVGQTITIPNGEYAAPKISRRYSRKIRSANRYSYSGYYMRPIRGGRKTQGIHGYNGVDLAVACGSPVVASASGDVIISKTRGWNAGAGKYIVIKHPNNTQTLYAHLSDNIVFKGWHVVKGQVIGYVGSTGLSTGCHTHFEIRGRNAPRNPF